MTCPLLCENWGTEHVHRYCLLKSGHEGPHQWGPSIRAIDDEGRKP